MSRDLVIIPSYWRPEFLYLCLEAIYAADGSYDKHIRVVEDVKDGDDQKFPDEIREVQEVLAYWKRGLGSRLQTILRPANTYYGNSFNLLEAYKRAYHEDWDHVYLIEDDILISTDFFIWHEGVQKDHCFFATIAGQTGRNSPADDLSHRFFISRQYASLGVCWKRQNLSWVDQHAVPSYYQNSTLHIVQHFKNSSLGLKMMEQDGLIQRIAEQEFQTFAYSTQCRAFHIGAWGYHRGIGAANMFTGTLAERIEKVRAAVSDPTWFQKVADFQTDLQPFPKAKSEPAFGSLKQT